MSNLPPDPDEMNEFRADCFNEAVVAFTMISGPGRVEEDDQTILRDMLCNMFHWCDRHGVDAGMALMQARACYNEEIGEKS